MTPWVPTGKQINSKNIFHRYMKLPFEITKHPLCDTTPDTVAHHDINPYRDSKIEDFNHSLGLITVHTEVFYTPPGGELPIHADDMVIDNRAKINITWGPPEGTVRWWKSEHAKPIADLESAREMLGNELQPDEEFSERQHTNLLAKKEDCELVWEANTNKVSLLNVGQLHSTYNPTDVGRWTLCFVPASSALRGGHYLTFEEALEVYADYITGDDNGN